MHFQFAYYRLEDFVRSLAMEGIDPSFDRLDDFLFQMERALQPEILAVKIEPDETDTSPKALGQRQLVKVLRGQTKTLLSDLLKRFPSYPYLFQSTHLLLERDPRYTGVLSPEVQERKKLVKLFNDAFTLVLRNPTVTQDFFVGMLSNLLNGKLKEAKSEGSLIYNPDVVKLKEMVCLQDALRNDSVLNAIADNDLYVFSRAHYATLTYQEYQIIQKYPVSHLFLLAGLGVTELDPPHMVRTIEATKDLVIPSLIKLAESTKKNLGTDKFQALLRAIYENPMLDLNKFPALLHAANNIGGKANESFGVYLLMIQENPSWESIAAALPDLYSRALQEAHDPIPNEEVYDSYRKPSYDVLPKYMPEESELTKSIAVFEEIDKLKHSLYGLPEDELLRKLHQAVVAFRADETPENEARYEPIIWASLRELFRQTYGIFLYNTQMLNAHLILKGASGKNISQIKTGEGKSALQVIMMSFRALTTDKKQFNVTTASHLAERDAVKFSPFYEKLGLSCTVNDSSDPRRSNLSQRDTSYFGNIVYGTASAFQFGYMLSMGLGREAKKLRAVIKPAHTDVYIDEVDALVIDKEKTVSQISEGADPFDPYDHSGVYHVIWQYMWENRGSLGGKLTTYSLNGLRMELIKKGYFTPEDMQKRDNLYTTNGWYQSGISALHTQRDRDYVIQPNPRYDNDPSIVIVDRKGSGTLQHGSVWSEGLHQLLSAREGIPVPKETHLQCAITQRSFFNLFNALFAVTGTTGGELCEDYLNAMYPGVSIRNMPRYRASRASMIEPSISVDKKAQYDALLADIVEARTKGYPLLFLFETIRETKAFQAYAAKEGHDVFLLTGEDSSSMDNTLALAGLPGNVLVATFLAGRGADIIPSPEAEANGGLGVRVCNPPINERVMWQNFGRTGRQGRQGTFTFRLCREDVLLEIQQLERRILSNRFLTQPFDETARIPKAAWEKEYEPVMEPLLVPPRNRTKGQRIEGAGASAAEEPVVDAAGEPVVDTAGELEVDTAGELVVDTAGELEVDTAGELVVDTAGEPVEVDTPADTVQQLMEENQARESALVAKIEGQYGRDSERDLLLRWETLRMESERLENFAGLRYAQYTDLLYEIQRLTYDSEHPRLIAALTKHYRLLMSDMNNATRERMYMAFERRIGETLLEMGKDAALSAEDLRALALKTNNPVMVKCLSLAETKRIVLEDETHDLTKLYESTQQNLGEEKFQALIRFGYHDTTMYHSHVPALLNAANTIGDKAPIAFSLLIDMLKEQRPWHLISKELPFLYARASQETYDPIPNEVVYASYLTPTNDTLVDFMPSEQELRKGIEQFEAIDALCKELMGMPEALLQDELREAVAAFKAAATEKARNDCAPRIWAILREVFRQTYGILLYSTQMINAHLILHPKEGKMIAQIKTGEGKSALQTIMMAFNALTTDKKQYNVTSANHLAERDAAKFAPYYEKLGLLCTSNVSSSADKSHLFSNPESYEGHIVYGTAEAFEFGYLLSIDPKYERLRCAIRLEKTDVFIDEVDSLVIDKEHNMSRIQESVSDMNPFDTTGLYPAIWQYIWERRNTGTDSMNGLRAELIRRGFFTDETMQKRSNLLATAQWYSSAQKAVHLERDKDYVIKEDADKKGIEQIVIVDRKGTGTLQYGTVWEHGLHQIIEAKEGVPIRKEAGLRSAIAQSSFFNMFDKLYAVTGTTGGKACEEYLHAMYPGSSIRNLPRYRPSHAEAIPHSVSIDKAAQYAKLLEDVREARAKGQPLLFLFETIKETRAFADFATARGEKIAVLTGDDDSSVENILAVSGQPGSVLAATFLAGRGADITPSREAEASGGLGVRVCSPPCNGRVVWQNFGRTGRQGRQGSFAFRFSRDELLLEIASFNQNIWRNQELLQPDLEIRDLPAHPWEVPYEAATAESAERDTSERSEEEVRGEDLAEEGGASATGAGAGCSEILQAEHQAKSQARATMIGTLYHGMEDDELLLLWERLRDESEHIDTRVGAKYAGYTELVCALQRLVYDTTRTYFPADRRFIAALTENYQLVMSDLALAFKNRMYIAFEKSVGNTLLEMGRSIGLNASDLGLYAKNTHNPLMVRCLQRTQDLNAATDFAISALGDTGFFASKRLRSTVGGEDLSLGAVVPK